MAFSIRLDPATERAITRLGRQRGQTKAAVVREAIAAYAAQQDGQQPSRESAYTRLAPFIGAADSKGSRRSERTGDGFVAVLTSPRRARRPR